MYELLLKAVHVVDPANGVDGIRDIAVEAGRIAAVEEEIDSSNARRVLHLAGKTAVPGIIDTHVHVCRPFGGQQGYRMLARAGVTTALDLAGYADKIRQGISESGTGLNIAYVYPIVPGETVTDRDPDASTISELCRRAVEEGALGVKVLGGHFPLTPEATARAIEIANEQGAYVAIHAGTTATGSNMNGVLEALELAGDNWFHLAHVNSYCRGQVTGDPLEEAATVLKALRANSTVTSESYLGLVNGAVAEFEGGVPKSNVVKTCLKLGGFQVSMSGMRDAIVAGWAKINKVVDGETVLLPPEDGLAHFEAEDTKVGISFPVNSVGGAISIAVNRKEGFMGDFTVDAISTDGGAYPRNTIVSQGLPLVRYGALSMQDFVRKTSINPAKMLGLVNKGHLGPGADADVSVLDLVTGKPHASVARGDLVMLDGEVVGKGGCLLVSADVADGFEGNGFDVERIRPTKQEEAI